MKILFLGDPLSNTKQWIGALENFADCEVINWYISGKRRLPRIIKWLMSVFFIKYWVKKYKADIVIGYRTTSYGFLAVRTGIKPCVIAAQGESDVWPLSSFLTPFKRTLHKYAVRHADLIHSWGHHMKASLLDSGANDSKILVCPRGIDLQKFKPALLKKSEPILQLIVTRTLHKDYGHDTILRAAKILDSKGLNFKLTFAGEGIEKSALKELSKELGIGDKVNFPGNIENDHLPEYLAASDIYISMPVTEGVSASLFEAMACGCFPIVSKLRANESLIENGKNGFLIEVGNYNQLSERISEAIENKKLSDNAIEINLQIVKEKADIKKNMVLFRDKYKQLINELA